jgi:hypothetical protein
MRISRSSSQRFSIASALSSALGCAAVLLCSQSSELHAQVVQLRPHASLSLPTQVSIENRVLHVRQKIGMNVGARLIVTFNERFDVVTSVSYMPGYIRFHGAGKKLDVRTGSHVLSGTTGARYWLLSPGRKLSWEVHSGLGVAFGGQPAYEDLFESSTVSGVVGSTVRYQIGQIVSLHLKIQNRLYRVRFGQREPVSSRPPLQISFGLGLPFLESALRSATARPFAEGPIPNP